MKGRGEYKKSVQKKVIRMNKGIAGKEGERYNKQRTKVIRMTNKGTAGNGVVTRKLYSKGDQDDE